MAQLQLVYLRTSPQPVGTEIVHYERIKALLEIGTTAVVRHDCLVDSGAVLSVFPEKYWRGFEREVDWLFVPGSVAVLPDWVAKVTGLGAKSVDCHIGKINIQILELPVVSGTYHRSPATEVIAKFPYDNGAFSQILLGLGGKALFGAKLIIDSANGRAWLDY